MVSHKIIEPRLDHRPTGEFVVSATPVFSWKMECSRQGAAQSAYQISVKDDDGKLLWQTEKVYSNISAAVPWGGKPLKSRQRGSWSLEVWDENGHSAVSGDIPFETTLLNNCDWQAKWIYFDGNNPAFSAPCPYFRKKFTLAEKPVRARLYISAKGLFEAFINGEKAGCDRFVPGWTDFNKHLQFLTYDVTAQCQVGDNLIGAILGEGWYCGCGRRKNYYGTTPELLIQLEVTFSDGSVKKIVSGDNWKCSTGPLMYSDIYDGEFYDARMEMPGWNTVDFNDRKWRKAVVGSSAAKSVPLVPKYGEPVRQMMSIKPVRVLHPKPDVWIWDAGQNISGIPRIRIGGSRGRLYTIRFGEMLYDDDTLYNLNYRGARSTDYCAMNDNGTMVYEPTFTFHGFRYMQIDGFQFSNSAFTVDDVEVEFLVLYSALDEAGSFECGNEKLNQLYRNTLWSQRDNFFEIPTDCPQRDERLGWTGDAQVFAATACCNMFTYNFFRKYLQDVRDAQRSDGAVASVCPDILKYSYGAAGWADAITIIPWVLYQRYGDDKVLQENFEAMEKWVNFQRKSSDGLIRPKTYYGDHLNFSPVETPSELLGTAYFYYSAVILSKSAAVLGSKAKSARYARLAAEVREAYCKKFVGSDGIVNIHSQTALALSLYFGLVAEKDRQKNGEFLAQLIRENGNRLTTGFLGTSCLNQALSGCGQTEVAFELYLQEEFPSWLFSVNQGATTIWERWNSYTVKDGFGNVNMNSFNHYAYGAVQEWVFATVCGIDYTAVNGTEICFACHPEWRMKFARATENTPAGIAVSAWKFVDENKLIWEISAPANSKIKVVIPEKWVCNTDVSNLVCGKYTLELQRKD